MVHLDEYFIHIKYSTHWTNTATYVFSEFINLKQPLSKIFGKYLYKIEYIKPLLRLNFRFYFHNFRYNKFLLYKNVCFIKFRYLSNLWNYLIKIYYRYFIHRIFYKKCFFTIKVCNLTAVAGYVKNISSEPWRLFSNTVK